MKFQLRRRRTEDGQREKQVQRLQGKREHSRCEKKARVELRKPEVDSKVGMVMEETMYEEAGAEQVMEHFRPSKPHQGLRLYPLDNGEPLNVISRVWCDQI